MFKEEKLISVILPVYNAYKKELIEAINSVTSQTYKNLELLIINDASNNGIEKFLSTYDFRDERIKVINNEKNLRLTKTLNKGLKLAKGEYIARIDDEDVWTDTKKLEKQIKFLENNPDYGVCGTNSIATDKQGNVLFYQSKEETDKEIKCVILQRCPFLHVSVLFRKSCVNDFGDYNSKWDYVEDHELWLRFGKKYKFYNIQDNCVSWKIDPNGVSARHKIIQKWNILKLSFIYRKYYPHNIFIIIQNILHLLLSFFPLKFILFLIKLKNGKNPKY